MNKAHRECVKRVASRYGLKQADVDECIRWTCRNIKEDLMAGLIKSIRLSGIGSVIRRDTPYVKKEKEKEIKDDKKEHKKHLFLQRRVQTL